MDKPAYRPCLFVGRSPQRAAFEAELARRGVHLPVQQRIEWSEVESGRPSWLVGVADRNGHPVWGVGLSSRAVRALPGHHALLASRFRCAPDESITRTAVAGLVAITTDSRVVRVEIDVWDPEAGGRETAARILTEAGFVRQALRRSYRRTLLVSLVPSEADLLTSFHATARRHIRAVGKNPLAMRGIDDPAFAPRMRELEEETWHRTGSRPPPDEWGKRILLSRSHGSQARIVGLLRTDRAGPGSLLAFALGLNHGGVAEYAAAASTRANDLKVPLLYGPTWDLMCWAKHVGCTTFDLGGISDSSDTSDPRSGIARFKERFCGEAVEVGASYHFSPPSWAARADRLLRGAARVARSAWKGRGRR